MALSAYYVEDPITRLVSITIGIAGGAVVVTPLTRFVSGDAVYLLLRGVPRQNPPPGETPQTWTATEQQAYVPQNGAYHAVHKPGDPPGKLTPTFVRGTTASTAASHEIRYSHDGTSWTVCHTIPTSGRGYGWSGGTWNPTDEKFWLCLNIWQTADASDTLWEEVQFFSSSDGISWTGGEKFLLYNPYDRETDPIEVLLNFIDNTWPEWLAMVTAKFQEKLVNPANRGGIPDGYQAYDVQNEIFMKPTPMRGWAVGGGVDTGAPAEGITVEGVSHPTTSPPGWCCAVSFAGGIWNALCADISPEQDVPIRIYASTDNGRTWLLSHDDHGNAQFYGMHAGQAADFSPER